MHGLFFVIHVLTSYNRLRLFRLPLADPEILEMGSGVGGGDGGGSIVAFKGPPPEPKLYSP